MTSPNSPTADALENDLDLLTGNAEDFANWLNTRCTVYTASAEREAAAGEMWRSDIASAHAAAYRTAAARFRARVLG